MKVDLHTHILPPNWPDLKQRFGGPGWPRMEYADPSTARIMIDDRCFREVSANSWDASKRLEECDAAGVDVQVLSTVPVMFSYWARGEQAYTLSRFLNDHLAEVVRAHPTRFVALGTVPLQSPDMAARELERCVQELGMPGIQIGTHVNDWNLDEPALLPLFERAHELKASIFIHPWDMMAKEKMPRYFLPWLVGIPAETSLAMASIIFSGMLDRLPDMRLAFAHGGGGFPHSIGRMDRGFEARPDLCAVNISQPPSAYLRRLYVDSLVHDADVLRFLVDRFGPQRVALGTDYPFPLGEEHPGRLIESLGLDEDVRSWLLGRTALEFLGLPLDFARPTQAASTEAAV